jgi:hypothetical protein
MIPIVTTRWNVVPSYAPSRARGDEVRDVIRSGVRAGRSMTIVPRRGLRTACLLRSSTRAAST